MVLVQTWPFFQLFFLGNINQENVFNDILERKNAFLGYKKKNPKSRKIYIFFNGVNPWFWSKNDHFSNFFLSNIRQKNVFYDIPELNNALLFYKNKKSKNLKKLTFFKKRLTHGFCPKQPIFATFFKAIQARKMFFMIFQQKTNASQGYKNKNSNKSTN